MFPFVSEEIQEYKNAHLTSTVWSSHQFTESRTWGTWRHHWGVFWTATVKCMAIPQVPISWGFALIRLTNKNKTKFILGTLFETKIYHWKLFTSITFILLVLTEIYITHATPAKNKTKILVSYTLQDNKIHLQNFLRCRCSRVNANDLLALDGLKLPW